MLRTIILLAACSLACEAAAADLSITGKWMVTEFANRATGADGGVVTKGSAQCPPGALTIEIGDATMTSTIAMFPGRKPEVRTMTYSVVEASADSVTILVVSAAKKDGERKTFRANGTGLTVTDEKTISSMIPYDPAAVAAEQQRIAEGNRPADPLLDRPLAGRLNGADWTPIACRRSHFQFDKTGGQIRVGVTADRPKGFEPSAMPSLIIELPTKPGEYPLSPTFNFTIVTPPANGRPTGNRAVINGKLVVYSVTDTAIAFGLSARGMDGNVVNGRMTADVSPLTDE